MKKSEIYYFAQIAVLEMDMNAKTRLEMLRELMTKEDMEAFCEREVNKEEETHA